MSDINILADKIESAIKKTISYAAELDSGIVNYGLLFNSKKSDIWYIVFFFDDKTKLKNSLNDGTCYSVFMFMQKECEPIDENPKKSIRFEIGKGILNEQDYISLHDKFIKKYEPAENEAVKICSACGHSWDKHKLIGLKGKDGSVPKTGWMICPEDNCTCFMTWDTAVNFKEMNGK